MRNSSFGRLCGQLACATALIMFASSATANQQQLQATVAKHFLQNHQAIPLHNNGNVKSGDVLHLPEEATYVSRSKCYDLPAVRYTSLKSEFIRTTSELAAEAGGEIPADKIAQIEAQVGGKLIRSNLIILDPLSQEEPPTGYSVLQRPKAAPDCDIIGASCREGPRITFS